MAIASMQCAREVSLKRMKEPLHSDGDIIKDGRQLSHQQEESCGEITRQL